MPGMKRDCGGAAGILGAFYAAVKQGMIPSKHILDASTLDLISFSSTTLLFSRFWTKSARRILFSRELRQRPCY